MEQIKKDREKFCSGRKIPPNGKPALRPFSNKGNFARGAEIAPRIGKGVFANVNHPPPWHPSPQL
jgi:hypothetical protein